MLNKRTLAAAATLLAIAVAGCGGSSAKDYEKKVKTIGNEFRDEVQSAQSNLASNAKDPAAAASALEKFKNAFNGVADKIDKLDPPSGAKDEQDKLVSVLRRGADDIGTVEDAVKNKDTSAISSSVSKLQTDSSDAASSLEDLKKAVDK